MASLYELTGNFLEAQEMLFDEDTNMETILNTLDCIDCLIEEKADAYAKILQNMDKDVSALDKEITRLKNRKEMLQKRGKKLKENLKSAMEITGKTKFKTALFSFSVCQNSGVHPIKVDVDAKYIPEEYTIPQPPKANIEAIRKALLNNEELNFAHLEQRGTSLRIK